MLLVKLSQRCADLGSVSSSSQRTLTEPPALKNSHFAYREHASPSSFASLSKRTSGVLPMQLRMLGWIIVVVSCSWYRLRALVAC